MKKQKKIISILITILISLNLISCNSKKDDNFIDELNKIEKENNFEEKINIKNKENISTKNFKDDLQKNLRLKKLINLWDNYINENEYVLALRNYIKAKGESPENKEILKKIWDTYFLMKKFNKSLDYYNKINDLNIVGSDKYILNMIYLEKFPEKKVTINLTNSWTTLEQKENIENIELIQKVQSIQKKILDLEIDEQKKFYYTNALWCLINFHICKEKYQNYLAQDKLVLKEKRLINIKEKLKTYKNFGIEELYLKNAYLISSFFEYKLFPISINLSKELLREKTNYKPILKIIAQSYFELWDLYNTKKYLTRYYAIDNNDPDVAYMLWVVNQKLNNYLLSNIQLNKAISLWAKNKANIYRLEIYNYLILKDFDKILSTFDKLINLNEKPDYNDLILATYYNIITWNIKNAQKLINIWIKNYPEKEDFYWFKWWVLEKKWKSNEAKEEFLKWHKIDNKNALINYHLWKIMLSNDDLIKARIYFIRAEKLDNWWDISKLAIKWLKEIEIIKEQKKKQKKK